VKLFKDRGYPKAAVDASERPGKSDTSVIVTYRAEPGPQLNFGPVTVQGIETLQEKHIVRELRFHPGQLYDERLVTRSQRRLGALELLEVSVITPRLDSTDGNTVPMTVTVAEGKPRLLRLGLGYGSEELARGTLTWQHLNFHGGAKQATVDAKYSRIERGIDLGLLDPHVFVSGLSGRLGATGWRTQQLTYDSERYGGSYGLKYQTERGPSRSPIQYHAGVTFAYQRLRYGIRPEFLDDQSRRDERIALGLDPDTGRASGRLATIEVDLDRYALDNVTNPRRGTTVSGHIEFASPLLGGTYRYTEVGGEARGFMPMGAIVLAARANASTLVSFEPTLVPFSKRYFLGGTESLRGWSRFEVSPLDDEGRPVGGRSVFDFSLEARIPVPRPASLSVVPFIDGGNVWMNSWDLNPNDLRYDIGSGLRYATPIGPVRFDFGYQLNPIEGLLVNGKPETRHYRLHFSIGQAF